jgi:hypothetical protein
MSRSKTPSRIPSPPSVTLSAFDPETAIAAEISWRSPGHDFVVERATVEAALTARNLPASIIPDRGATSVFSAFCQSSRARRTHTIDPDTNRKLRLVCVRNFKRTDNGVESVVFTLHTVQGTDKVEEELTQVGALVWEHDKASGLWSLTLDKDAGWDELSARVKGWALEIALAAPEYVQERLGECDGAMIQQCLSGYFSASRQAVSQSAGTWVVTHTRGDSRSPAERAVALAEALDETTPFRIFAKSIFPNPADIRQAAWVALDKLANDIAAATAECEKYGAATKMKGEKRLAEKLSRSLHRRSRGRESR